MSEAGVGVGSLRWLALLVVVVSVSAIAVWVTSPRFAIDTPSLVDDWSAIAYSREQLSDVIRFANPEQQRFRPGMIAWNYVQWHTFDAPKGLIGPNAWNLLRILILVAGLCVFTALALPRPTDRMDAVVYAGIAGLPAFLVVTVPKFARDLARLGPQEPLLVGGMALGGSLLVLLARLVLDGEHPVPRWRATLLGVPGAALWLLGVYHKETSLCVLPLIIAVLVAGRSWFAGWRGLSTARRVTLGVIGAIVFLPLVHVAIETARIAGRGDLVYGAEVDSGGGAIRDVQQLYDWAHEAMPRDARLLALGAVVLTVVVALARRKPDVIALGALASGALSFVFAAQSGVVATRYYIPVYALFAVALSLSLARLPRFFQVSGVLVVFFAFMPPSETRSEVSRWTDEERRGSTLVRAVADLDGSGCVVATAGLDPETGDALPVLADLERRRTKMTCAGRDVFFVVRPFGEGAALLRACDPAALETVLDAGEVGGLYRCTRLSETSVRDPALGVVEPKELVRLRQMRTRV